MIYLFFYCLKIVILGEIVKSGREEKCERVISRKLLIELLICKDMYALYQIPELPLIHLLLPKNSAVESLYYVES